MTTKHIQLLIIFLAFCAAVFCSMDLLGCAVACFVSIVGCVCWQASLENQERSSA